MCYIVTFLYIYKHCIDKLYFVNIGEEHFKPPTGSQKYHPDDIYFCTDNTLVYTGIVIYIFIYVVVYNYIYIYIYIRTTYQRTISYIYITTSIHILIF